MRESWPIDERFFKGSERYALCCFAVVSFCVPTSERLTRHNSTGKRTGSKPLAAAKKEGQVTVYIYRYEGLLQDFKRDYPGINVVSVTGRGNELTNRIMAERRARQIYRRRLQRRDQQSLQHALQRQGARSAQAAADSARSHRYFEMVWQRASLRRSGGEIYLCLHRRRRATRSWPTTPSMVNPKEFKSYWDVTQSQVERQNRLPRSARHAAWARPCSSTITARKSARSS